MPVAIGARPRWQDYVELTKPRISVMVLFTVAAGALLALEAPADLMQLLHALIGTALVASGASALNQWLERHSDGQMRRTESRPLPAGRLNASEVIGKKRGRESNCAKGVGQEKTAMTELGFQQQTDSARDRP
jgi:heme O synthase-like polyprenyltransferase